MPPATRPFLLADSQLTGHSIIAASLTRPAADEPPPAPSSAFCAHWPVAGRDGPRPFFSATAPQVAAACSAAAEAFNTFHVARSALASHTARWLTLLADRCLANQAEILALASRETGLTRCRLAREFGRMIGTLKLFAELAASGSWQEVLHSPPLAPAQAGPFNADLRRVNIPLGPVAVFTASNFPLAYGVCGGDFASAVCTGCPVIIKGHPAHPGTGEFLARLAATTLAESGLPSGFFSFLHAGGDRERPVGRELVLSPSIRAVGFTGSIAGGEALRHLIAAERQTDPIPLFAENGSCNLVLVCQSALRTRASQVATDLAISLTDSVGQQCTNTGLVAIEGSAADAAAFASQLATLASRAPARPMLTPRIAQGYHHRLQEVQSAGAATLAPNPTPRASTDPRCTPTILLAPIAQLLASPTLRDEVFGPAAIITAGSPSELAQLAHHSRGMLVGSIYGDAPDHASVRELTQALASRAGRIVLNGVPTGVRVAPAMVHGGPHPATSDPASTAVGPLAARRWTRPVCFQHTPGDALATSFLPGQLSGHLPAQPS